MKSSDRIGAFVGFLKELVARFPVRVGPSIAPIAVTIICGGLGLACYGLFAEILHQNLIDKSRILGGNLKLLVADPYAMGEYDGIGKIFAAAQSADNDIQSILMLTGTGEVLASTDAKYKAGARISASQLKDLEVKQHTARPGANDQTLEVIEPINWDNKDHSIVRIEMSKVRMNGLLQSLQIRIGLAVLMAGLLSASIVRSLSSASAELHSAVNVLSQTVSRIRRSVTESLSSITQTVGVVHETTTAVEQLKVSSQHSRDEAKSVFETARLTGEISDAGRQATEDTVAAMRVIRGEMDLVASSMRHLAEKSRNIVGIVATVDDLSRQSKLLAVNAAIEAAKAGEHGLGFAVVADEVKNLAEQSTEATKQIRTMINEILSAAASSSQATEKSGLAVDAAGEQSNKASKSITQLTKRIADSALVAARIVSASEEQVTGADQVVGEMQSIRDAADRDLSIIKELDEAGNSLSSLGERLQELVKQYSPKV